MSRPQSRTWSSDSGGFEVAGADDIDEEHPARKAKCCNAYFRFVYLMRHCILFFWLVALCVSVWLGPRFLNNTKDSFQPPAGTPSAAANAVWLREYKVAANQHSLIILLSSNEDNQTLIAGPGREFSQSVDAQFRAAFLNRTESDLDHASDYTSIQSYWTVINSPVSVLASNFLAPNQKSMVYNLAFHDSSNAAVGDVVKHVRSVVSDIDTSSGRYTLGVTGPDALNADIGSSAKDDFEHTDAIILPIALFVLMLYLKSVRLMVLPLACVVLSLLSAMASMLPIALYVFDVASFAPSIMASLTVAMSVDYSLFLLTRYREEILSGVHRRESEAVQATLRTSGEVILASGCTLAITFASLIAFPMDFLQSIGVGAVATITACLLVNLTFTPAMLVTFPHFFSNFTMPKLCWCVLPNAYTRDVPTRRFGDFGLDEAFLPTAVINTDAQARSAGVHAGLAQELLYDQSLGESSMTSFGGDSQSQKFVSPRAREDAERARREADAASRARFRSRSYVDVVGDDGLSESTRAALEASPRLRANRADQEGSFWYKSAVFSTGTWRAVMIMLLILGASVPFILATARLKYTIAQDELLPSSSQAVQVLDRMEGAFPPGLISQYHVLLTVDKSHLPSGSRDQPILSTEYLSTTTDLVQSLINVELVANSSVMSLVYAGGSGSDAWTSTSQEAQSKLAQPCPGSDNACLFLLQIAETANNLNTTEASCTQVSLMTSFPPMGDQAEPWIKKVRKVLDEVQARANHAYPGAFEIYMTGGATSAVDAIEKIYSLLPIVVIVTVGCVLILTGLLFRSLVVPLRLVLTLAIPLAWTYGVAVYIYQDHTGFGWLGTRVAQAQGLYWLNPVMAFSILVGLGLDYDLFLSLRIAEFRHLGYGNTAAIRKGVYKTGSIITGAGLIMGIAFFGLMLSSTAVLLEFGSMLMLAVLFDTFIVRTIFLPAVLHLLGEATWWPGKVPKPSKGDLDQDVDEHGLEQEQQQQQYNFR